MAYSLVCLSDASVKAYAVTIYLSQDTRYNIQETLFKVGIQF